MVTAYVYAPATGIVTQLNNSGHYPCTDGGTASALKPIDLAINAGNSFNLYVNYPYVKCIYVEKQTSGAFECCDSETYLDIKRAVKVTLYGQTNYGCYLGWVLFGHINQVGFNLQSGNISSSNCGQLGTIINASGYSCYNGPHLHMECSSDGGYARTFILQNQVNKGGTAIYTWSKPTCSA